MASATDAGPYIAATLHELGLDAPAVAQVQPGAFVGVASDGRDLMSLLYEPVIAAKVAVGDGAAPSGGLMAGLQVLDRIVLTQIADAGRGAAGVAIVARPQVTGWVRMLTPPSCSRCAVLAGKFYRWNQGFARHPRCDCVHIPATESIASDLTVDARAAVLGGRVTGLSRADTRAIVDDHADVGQVINAHRGMFTAGNVKATSEAAPRGVQRLMPESIYRQAGADRAKAIELLRQHGYLTT